MDITQVQSQVKKVEEAQEMDDLKITAGEEGWYLAVDNASKDGEQVVAAFLRPENMPHERLGAHIQIGLAADGKTIRARQGNRSWTGTDVFSILSKVYQQVAADVRSALARRKALREASILTLDDVFEAAQEYERNRELG